MILSIQSAFQQMQIMKVPENSLFSILNMTERNLKKITILNTIVGRFFNSLLEGKETSINLKPNPPPFSNLNNEP